MSAETGWQPLWTTGDTPRLVHLSRRRAAHGHPIRTFHAGAAGGN
jgi:hypothetical protein